MSLTKTTKKKSHLQIAKKNNQVCIYTVTYSIFNLNSD